MVLNNLYVGGKVRHGINPSPLIHIDFFSVVNCIPVETDGETTEKGDQTVTG